ncbi:hypothetical protein [Desulfogranum marinum]|jgi:hypothetical protein|uniref:hypothetical protein n=1 Tax=Desulfogranum marinum TaxID=453220 RepID=UPI00196647DE|nr:hypothetical protein [Desulfogranum marinum]MBM9513419.1 hypothetical protein [Desulfogranum marinum]
MSDQQAVPAVEIRNLSSRYNQLPVLPDVDFVIGAARTPFIVMVIALLTLAAAIAENFARNILSG